MIWSLSEWKCLLTLPVEVFDIPGVNSLDFAITGLLPDSLEPSMGSSNRRVHSSSRVGTWKFLFLGSHTRFRLVFSLISSSVLFASPLFSGLLSILIGFSYEGNRLLPNCNFSSFNSSISAGRYVSLLLNKSNCLRAFKLPMDWGRLSIWLPLKLRILKFVMLNKDEGRPDAFKKLLSRYRSIGVGWDLFVRTSRVTKWERSDTLVGSRTRFFRLHITKRQFSAKL